MPTKEAELYALTGQIRTLFHKMANTIDELHWENGITAGMRAVLEMLSAGDKTVPEMARLRQVSRQHIQLLVNDLIEAGFAETKTNPAHKRSSLISQTQKGSQAFAKVREKEKRLLSTAAKKINANDLQASRDVLTALDTFFSSQSAAPALEKET